LSGASFPNLGRRNKSLALKHLRRPSSLNYFDQRSHFVAFALGAGHYRQDMSPVDALGMPAGATTLDDLRRDFPSRFSPVQRAEVPPILLLIHDQDRYQLFALTSAARSSRFFEPVLEAIQPAFC
jgi:hypothetical protein